MSIISINQKIENFDKWKEAFDKHNATRDEYGINILNVFRGIEDRNKVTVIAEETKPDALKAFMGSEKVQLAMKDAGVLGPPEISIFERIS
jgi:hypothetical protein